MAKKTKEKIIAKFKFDGNEVIIKADTFQYILIIKNRYTFHECISDCFEQLFGWLVKERLLGEKGKSIKEIVKIMRDTKKEILEIIEPFEHLKPI